MFDFHHAEADDRREPLLVAAWVLGSFAFWIGAGYAIVRHFS